MHLCASLLLLNLVFLVDGWLARYPLPPLCIGTAAFLHYFLLTSFTWSGLEALHMYLSIVQVFTPYLSRYMLKFSLAGWGQFQPPHVKPELGCVHTQHDVAPLEKPATSSAVSLFQGGPRF